MDDQQQTPARGTSGQGVSVGAGLQESRINTDLIDFLRKYGPYALYATLIIVGLYAATNWYKQREARAMDSAFMALNRALESNSTGELLSVADEHGGKGAVAELAQLRAAVIITEAARLGVTPETPSNLRQNPPEENRLTDEQAAAQFAQAEELYRGVLQRTRGSKDRYLVAQQARWGLASVLSTQGEFDEAKQIITEYGEAARRYNWESHASVAEQRLVLLDEAARYGALPGDADLPESNRAPATMPAPQQQPGLGFGTTQGQQGMPVPGVRPQGQPDDGMSVNPISDPEMLRMLEEMRRQQQQGGQGGMPIPAPTRDPENGGE